MTNRTDQFSNNNILVTNQTDRSKHIGTLYAIIAGLSFLLFSIISFLICHPPFRKEIRKLFSSSLPDSNPQTQDEIESNLTLCGHSTNKLSRELKLIQTDQPTLMNPLRYSSPTLSLNSTTVKQSSINSESPISPLTIHSPLKTPLPIKTQITQPALVQTKDRHQIPNLRHSPHTISPILKNSPSHHNHLRSSSSNHELKSIPQDDLNLNQTDSNHLSASLPSVLINHQRYSLYDFNEHFNELLYDHHVRSKSTPLDLNPNHECYCKPIHRNSTSSFTASPITLEDDQIGLSHDVLISNEDLYSLNSCQVFPAGSDSHSIDLQSPPNTIDHLVMSHKTQVNDSIQNDNVSLESNEFYRGRTKSQPTTMINS